MAAVCCACLAWWRGTRGTRLFGGTRGRPARGRLRPTRRRPMCLYPLSHALQIFRISLSLSIIYIYIVIINYVYIYIHINPHKMKSFQHEFDMIRTCQPIRAKEAGRTRHVKQETDLVQSVQSVQSAGRHPNIVRCHGVLVQNEGTALSTSCVTTRGWASYSLWPS